MKKTRRNCHGSQHLCFLGILSILMLLATYFGILDVRVSAENVSGSVVIANFNVPVDPGIKDLTKMAKQAAESSSSKEE